MKSQFHHYLFMMLLILKVFNNDDHFEGNAKVTELLDVLEIGRKKGSCCCSIAKTYCVVHTKGRAGPARQAGRPAKILQGSAKSWHGTHAHSRGK